MATRPLTSFELIKTDLLRLGSNPLTLRRRLHPSSCSQPMQSPPPRPPPGYRFIKASPSQVLLPLTVSNKCGQAFRWRGVKIWEPLTDLAPSSPFIKAEPSSSSEGGPPFIKPEPGIELGFEDEATLSPPDAGHRESLRDLFEEQTEWSICLADRVVLLRQDEKRGYLYHRTLTPSRNGDTKGQGSIDEEKLSEQTSEWLLDYLNMNVPLESLYEEWSRRDKVFARFSDRFAGLRMLRQDPWECLCAFICSSNNNIARIGQMVQNLCTHFSEPLLEHTYPPCPLQVDEGEGQVKGESGRRRRETTTPEVKPAEATIVYYPFPSPETLAKPGVEARLRELGFGYRAKYLAQTAQMLCQSHPKPHVSLQRQALDPDPETELNVTGRPRRRPSSFSTPSSVASSNSGESPKKRKRDGSNQVVAQRDVEVEGETSPSPSEHSVNSYLHSLREMSYDKAKAELIKLPGVGPKVADCILLMSLDQPSSIPVDRHVFQFAARWYGLRSQKYEEIAETLRQLWGEYAGWAHSVLFTADLRSFSNYQPNLLKKEEEEQKSLSNQVKGKIKVKEEEEWSKPVKANDSLTTPKWKDINIPTKGPTSPSQFEVQGQDGKGEVKRRREGRSKTKRK
ncbi:DNA glycosylase [Violaceomyces palustris]|uniref:DNA glycosylase n=1 Tax=Violaceomyces palustris TaxID=1673888 RepID=A0ACD0NQ86_9BASI|nr:DNA glycosylase [Violaceomyces palustris]